MQDDVQIALRREAGSRLHVRVSGRTTLANTLAYWRAIADAIEAQPARELLLVDELTGPPLSAEEWRTLVAEVGPRLGQLRVAHVKPRGLETVEYCVLSAIGAGLQAQVFSDTQRASLWLSYGESPATPD
ncbi:hypothetical protein [Luteimonas kalidii]|uniref:STAS/SEC14 domain-containing protein n=1 Tax=Luteimonas kalidii TaxID=3042025 RepID=A0ABT6JWZ8_9GAMM|nr:hypothetical protein [Luteimonas kalidii]MDH5835112.1 hypothetical protein [Luteimonas kalidii]